MGVPGLYRTLFQRYGSTYHWVVPGNDTVVDYLYLDFNPVIYICYYNLCESGRITHEMPLDVIEKLLIIDVIKETSTLVNILVRPTKLLYIAIDGPAPKCKLVLQRDRRYKNIYEDKIIERIRAKYPDSKPQPQWNTSNITPGTPFMNNLNVALRSAISKGMFSHHPRHRGYTIVFSDSNFPGEGEHKITEDIERLRAEPNEKVCIYSNDGDMIILGCRFPDKNILIITNPSSLPKSVVGEHDLKSEYIYFDHTEFRKALFAELGDDFMKGKKPDRVLKDLMALSFLAGNDFVQPIPFMKMRYSHTFTTLIDIYRRVCSGVDRYLVVSLSEGIEVMKSYSLHHSILTNIMLELAKQENFRMRDYQMSVISKLSQPVEQWGPFQNWEEEWSKYQHTYYYQPNHPDSSECRDDFLHFRYVEPDHKHEWKMQYYSYHFGIESNIIDDKKEYNKFRTIICVKYLKSLIFTLRYYLNSRPPSWRWNYPHHVAPWPSDILVVLNKIKDMRDPSISYFVNNGISDVYTPLEQLLLTVPKQDSTGLFPKEYFPLTKLLPTVETISIEMVSGEKYIYAEPRLPPFNELLILSESKKIKLSPETKKCNRLNFNLFKVVD